MELLLRNPETGLAILAGLLLGGVILSVLFFLEHYRTTRRNSIERAQTQVAQTARVVFLFKGRRLIETCPVGEALIEGAMHASDPDEKSDDWDLIARNLRQRFSALPKDPDWQTGSGQISLDADMPDDHDVLLLDWWDGHVRLTVMEKTPDRGTVLPLPGDEAGWLRQAVRPHVFFQRRAPDGSACILIAWRQVPSICDGGRHDERTTNDLCRDRCVEGQTRGCDGRWWGA